MMKRMMLLFLLLTLGLRGWTQEDQVRAVVDQLFHAMLLKDTSALRNCFIPGVQLMSYTHDSKGNARSKSDSLYDFLRQIELIGETEIEEVLTGWQCNIDEGMASVWAPYEFFYDGKFSHCGVDNIQLMKIHDEWKITLIADTRRKHDCINDKNDIAQIDSLINNWHHAAAVADKETFFGSMTPEAIYIGTDPGERWLRDELAQWSAKYFDRKSAWDFKPVSRNIKIGPGGQLAWFDELLDTWMGTCRSTGIVEKKADGWKIVHYQLSIAVPNDKTESYLKLFKKE
jgi:ketosteroid isomerase-like protein